MKTYGTTYRTKYLEIFGSVVATVTANYDFFEEGIKGSIVVSNESEVVVLSRIAIPNGTVDQVKEALNKMFDTIVLS